jgi:hypothetical protein
MLMGLTVVLVACLLWPATSEATVACSFSGGKLTASNDASDQGVAIVRVGSEIRVIGEALFGFGPRAVAACSGGTPTVTNTDLVRIEEAATVRFGSARIQLGGGPFAPGATAEADGSSEIEFELSMPGRLGFAEIVGGAGPELIQVGSLGPGAGAVNLNTAAESTPDADVRLGGQEQLIVTGGGGRDLISAAGGNGFLGPFRGLFGAGGGAGRDVLVGGGLAAQLVGGPGRDRLVGTKGPDFLTGGGGRDLISGRGAKDLFFAFDGGRDRLRCGSGRDIGFSDPRDREKACERLIHESPFAQIKEVLKEIDEAIEEELMPRAVVWRALTSK